MSRADTIIAAAQKAGEDHIAKYPWSDDQGANERMKMAYIIGTLNAEVRILCREIEMASLGIRSAA